MRNFTDEDRKQLESIKRLFDEASAIRENGDVVAYAEKLADIKEVYITLQTPQEVEKFKMKRGVKIIRRSRDISFLDETYEIHAKSIYHLENRMRLSFKARMLGAPRELFDE